ncbi:MAG: YdhR family protein [Chloroflexota bacterium]|nr:YdhR family protein [Chloroflexota bacterium]
MSSKQGNLIARRSAPNGDIVAGLKKQPTIKDISAKVFDFVEDLTQKTRGPVKVAVTA